MNLLLAENTWNRVVYLGDSLADCRRLHFDCCCVVSWLLDRWCLMWLLVRTFASLTHPDVKLSRSARSLSWVATCQLTSRTCRGGYSRSVSLVMGCVDKITQRPLQDSNTSTKTIYPFPVTRCKMWPRTCMGLDRLIWTYIDFKKMYSHCNLDDKDYTPYNYMISDDLWKKEKWCMYFYSAL